MPRTTLDFSHGRRRHRTDHPALDPSLSHGQPGTLEGLHRPREESQSWRVLEARHLDADPLELPAGNVNYLKPDVLEIFAMM